MSRRPPNPSADRAAQNQQTLKTLVKLEGNKSCADCKRNKHPRWASWNLGIFVCIRCSGIHRGMGTHISRVKSVDLDAWTDEQLQSMLRWGNARANKYWEAKLAPGHIPAENKIENFIRTKYDSKRWVLEGGMPDPATLDAGGDDEIPLNVVQEKAKLDRSSSISRNPSAPTLPAATVAPAPILDLFGDTPMPSSTQSNADRNSRPSAASHASAPPPPRQQESTNAKGAKSGESLLGFDFFGASSSDPPSRPASAATTVGSTNNSRPDLKQSILSLYASAARSPNPPQQHSHTEPNPEARSFDAQPDSGKAPGGLDDAFGGLAFSNASSSPVAAAPRSSQTRNTTFNPMPAPSAGVSSNGTSRKPSTVGGNFFDAKPAIQTTAVSGGTAPRPTKGDSELDSSHGFGGFITGKTSSAPVTVSNSKPKNDLSDMFDFSTPPPSSNAQESSNAEATSEPSAFNLSSSNLNPQRLQRPTPMNNKGSNAAIFSGSDPWGSNEAWASTHNSAPVQSAAKSGPTSSLPDNEWSTPVDQRKREPLSMNPAQHVTADEDFGGWESSASVPSVSTKTPASATKPGGNFGGSEDLFSNVWE